MPTKKPKSTKKSTKSAKKSDQVFDVSKPGSASPQTGSRPIIVGHGAKIGRDPMVKGKSGSTKSELLPPSKKRAKVIEPATNKKATKTQEKAAENEDENPPERILKIDSSNDGSKESIQDLLLDEQPASNDVDIEKEEGYMQAISEDKEPEDKKPETQPEEEPEQNTEDEPQADAEETDNTEDAADEPEEDSQEASEQEDDAEEKPAESKPEEADTSSKEDEPKEETPEKKPEASTPEPKENDKPAEDAQKDEQSDDESGEGQEGGLVDELAQQAAAKKQKKEEGKQETVYQEKITAMINEKTYYVPVGQVTKRRIKHIIAAILLLALLVVGLNFALDAELLDIGISPLTNIL